jgi:hypothetical protein
MTRAMRNDIAAWVEGRREDPKLGQFLEKSRGLGPVSETIGEEIAGLASDALYKYNNGPRLLLPHRKARLAQAAVRITGSSGEAPLTWPTDPQSKPNMDALVKLVKNNPAVVSLLAMDGGHESLAMLYRILDAINQEPQPTPEGAGVFKEAFWAIGHPFAGGFPGEPEYRKIMVQGLARALNPDAQNQAITRFSELAASGALAQLVLARYSLFKSPDEMFDILSNAKLTRAALEVNGVPSLAPALAEMLAAKRATLDSEPQPRSIAELEELIAKRASHSTPHALLTGRTNSTLLIAKILAANAEMHGSSLKPIVGAVSFYKIKAGNASMAEHALFQVVVKDAQGTIIDQRYVSDENDDRKSYRTFAEWRDGLPKPFDTGRDDLPKPRFSLVTYPKTGHVGESDIGNPDAFESR